MLEKLFDLGLRTIERNAPHLHYPVDVCFGDICAPQEIPLLVIAVAIRLVIDLHSFEVLPLFELNKLQVYPPMSELLTLLLLHCFLGALRGFKETRSSPTEESRVTMLALNRTTNYGVVLEELVDVCFCRLIWQPAHLQSDEFLVINYSRSKPP